MKVSDNLEVFMEMQELFYVGHKKKIIIIKNQQENCQGFSIVQKL